MAEQKVVKDVTVKHEGAQIILPLDSNGVKMSYKEARDWLLRKEQEEDKAVGVYREFKYPPLDVLVSLQKAIASRYGWSDLSPTPGFFGSSPPVMVTVPIGPSKFVQVPWGRINLPGVTGYIQPQILNSPGKFCPGLFFGGETQNKYLGELETLFALTEKFLSEDSIYKGKALQLSFEWLHNGMPYNVTSDAPKFWNLCNIDEDDFVLSDSVREAIELGLFVPIEHSKELRECHIPLKRGVLLAGKYGVGKTLCAAITAAKATRNGWTFIHLDNVNSLQMAMEFGAMYAPVVIFAEDFDRAASGDRSVFMDGILNTFDGINSKDKEIIVVLTSNNPEEIHDAFKRPGRFDTIVEILPPDATAAVKLVQKYGRGLLADNISFDFVGRRLAGKIPAFIREVVERSKIAAIRRMNSSDIKGKVTEEDIIKTLESMEQHLASMSSNKQKANPKVELLYRILPQTLNELGSQGLAEDIRDLVEEDVF